jgi:hypothetical protein
MKITNEQKKVAIESNKLIFTIIEISEMGLLFLQFIGKYQSPLRKVIFSNYTDESISFMFFIMISKSWQNQSKGKYTLL